jgi:hypothetical protein
MQRMTCCDSRMGGGCLRVASVKRRLGCTCSHRALPRRRGRTDTAAFFSAVRTAATGKARCMPRCRRLVDVIPPGPAPSAPAISLTLAHAGSGFPHPGLQPAQEHAPEDIRRGGGRSRWTERYQAMATAVREWRFSAAPRSQRRGRRDLFCTFGCHLPPSSSAMRATSAAFSDAHASLSAASLARSSSPLAFSSRIAMKAFLSTASCFCSVTTAC